MANELKEIQNGGLISAIQKNGVGEILKPLIQEIHLFDSYVAGTTHLNDKSVLDEIKIGDKLNLRREDNKFDEHAILVLTEDGRKVGYVPAKDNLIFSRLMDAGKKLIAKISDIQKK